MAKAHDHTDMFCMQTIPGADNHPVDSRLLQQFSRAVIDGGFAVESHFRVFDGDRARIAQRNHFHVA